jgi:hypothetical protein
MINQDLKIMFKEMIIKNDMKAVANIFLDEKVKNETVDTIISTITASINELLLENPIRVKEYAITVKNMQKKISDALNNL